MQHIPVTAPTCASPGLRHRSSPCWDWHCHIPGGDRAGCRSPGCQGLTATPGDTTETLQQLQLLGDSPGKPGGVLVQPAWGTLHSGALRWKRNKDFISKSKAKSEGTAPHPNPRADSAGIRPGWKARGRRKAATGKTSHLYNRT